MSEAQPAPTPAPTQREAGTYPLAADQRTIVSLSFSPTSSCSGGTQGGGAVSPAATSPLSCPGARPALPSQCHEGNCNSDHEQRAFPLVVNHHLRQSGPLFLSNRPPAERPCGKHREGGLESPVTSTS